MRRYHLFFGFLVLLAFFNVTKGFVMSKGFVLASKIKGQLVADAEGTPVSGVKVIRHWKWAWNGKSGKDETMTDEKGYFVFNEVTKKSITASLLPHEPSIKQDFYVDFTDSRPSLLVLGLQKSNYKQGGELKNTQSVNNPINIRCRTDIEPEARGFYWGTCELIDE